MSRPATLKAGNTSYWTIMTYTSAGVLVDADSTPTIVVYKNGTLTADVVTVTKRSATTGIYDAYYNPASEAEGDCFTIQETATISSQAYVQSWNFEILAAERGTDNASTFDAASDTVTTDAASRTASQADVSALATSASIAALNDFDPASDAIQNVVTVGTITNAVTTDSASRTASQADVSAVAGASEVAAIDAVVDAIKAVTDNLPNSGSLTDLASSAELANVDSVADSVLVIANKLDSTMEADGLVSRFTTNALEQAPSSSGGDATASNQSAIITHLTDIKGSGFASTDTLEAIRDRGDAAWVTGDGGIVGPGAISHTVTVNSSGSPVDGVEVWVSTDVSGTNVIAGTLVTDAFGQVTFTLDAGSYYIWSQKAGVNFTNPTSFTVS